MGILWNKLILLGSWNHLNDGLDVRMLISYYVMYMAGLLVLVPGV